MSKYTTELRYICEFYAGLSESEGYNSINDIIDKSWDKVFDFDFPIFDESYRKILCTKLIKHYYTREICAETVGRWKLFMEDRFNLIMDKYNPLYKSLLIDFNPLYTVDYTREYTKKNVGNQENNGTSTVNTKDNGSVTDSNERDVNGNTTGKTTSMYSDTPQGSIIGLETQRYLTNATVGDSVGTSVTKETGTSESNTQNTSEEVGTAKNTIDVNNMEEYIEHVKGKDGSLSYGTLLKEFRENMIDVDDMVINEFQDCFFAIY